MRVLVTGARGFLGSGIVATLIEAGHDVVAAVRASSAPRRRCCSAPGSAPLAHGTPLPAAYFRAMRAWFWLGWPAFAAVLATYWLMTAKPAL